MVELRGVSFAVGAVSILADVSAHFRAGRLNVVLGPNGAGKSTLMRVAAGVARPTRGEVWYDGEPVAAMPVDRLARTRAMLSQHVELAFPLPARDVVLMGRYPHYGRTPRTLDREIVAQALELVGMSDRAEQSYDTLSGGERQKVQLARVLAQIWRETIDAGPRPLLFLDEPTSNLDVHYQLWLLEVAHALVGRGCTVVTILHDLNVALEHGEHFLLLNAGHVALETDRAADIPRDVVERVFRVSARRVDGTDLEPAYWRFSL